MQQQKANLRHYGDLKFDCCCWPNPWLTHRSANAAMALAALSEDEQRIVFSQLCNMLDPRGAVDFSSITNELWELTQSLRQQLRTDHEVAAALCRKLGFRSCKELREAKTVKWIFKGLSATDLALLGTLGSVLPALEKLIGDSSGSAAGPDGVLRLAERLGAGALPALTTFVFASVHVGDAGASALAAALGRGACVAHMHGERQGVHGRQRPRA